MMTGITMNLDAKPSIGSEISGNWANRNPADDSLDAKRRHSEGDKENQPDEKMREAQSEGHDQDKDVEMGDVGNEEKVAAVEEE